MPRGRSVCRTIGREDTPLLSADFINVFYDPRASLKRLDNPCERRWMPLTDGRGWGPESGWCPGAIVAGLGPFLPIASLNFWQPYPPIMSRLIAEYIVYVCSGMSDKLFPTKALPFLRLRLVIITCAPELSAEQVTPRRRDLSPFAEGTRRRAQIQLTAIRTPIYYYP